MSGGSAGERDRAREKIARDRERETAGIDEEEEDPERFYATCPPHMLGKWSEDMSSCAVDVKGQMGRVIGPKGANVIRLRAESGASMVSNSVDKTMIVSGPDLTSITKGARLVNAEVAKWLLYANQNSQGRRQQPRLRGSRTVGKEEEEEEARQARVRTALTTRPAIGTSDTL